MADSGLEKSLKELDGLKARGVITDDEYQARRAALLNAPPPPVVTKKGNKLRTLGIGCGVLVLGVVVLGVLLVALTGGGDDDDTTTSSAQRRGGDARVPLAVGSSGEVAPQGNSNKVMRVTILALQDNVQSTNQFSQPAEGNKYWGVQVEVENAGSEEITSPTWKLRDSANNELDPKIVAGVGEVIDPFFNLTPGGKRSGWVLFELPSSSTVQWIRADPNQFLSNDLYFEAQ